MKNNQKNNQLCSVNSLFYIWMYIIMLILFGNKTNYKVIFFLSLFLSLFLFCWFEFKFNTVLSIRKLKSLENIYKKGEEWVMVLSLYMYMYCGCIVLYCVGDS